MSDTAQWRKASIVADCVVQMVQETPETLTGNALIDEDYLRSKGTTDFSHYQCVPGVEPRKVWPPTAGKWFKTGTRGASPHVQARL